MKWITIVVIPIFICYLRRDINASNKHTFLMFIKWISLVWFLSYYTRFSWSFIPLSFVFGEIIFVFRVRSNLVRFHSEPSWIYTNRNMRYTDWIFFNYYFATPRPTLGSYLGRSLIYPMLITAFLHIWREGHREPRNEVGSLRILPLVICFLKSKVK